MTAARIGYKEPSPIVAHDVFICYSSKDKPTADAVCATLEQRGLRCWMAPRDVLAGTDWSESIIDAISGARAIVLVYSQHANESPQVRREIERAVHKRVAIVPFRIEDVPMSKSLEYFISTPHWLDALTPPLQHHLAHLADALTTLLRPPPPQTSGPPAPQAGSSPPPQTWGPPLGGPLREPSDEAAPPPVTPAPLPPPAPARDAQDGTERHTAPAPPVPAKRRWLKLAAAAAIVLALAGTAAYWFVLRSPVDPGLVGVWERKLVFNGLPIVEKSSIHVNGHRTVVNTFTDRGRYTASAGRWTMVNTGGLRTQGTYNFTGPHEVTIGGPFGSASWSRSENDVLAREGQLVGTFRGGGQAPDGLPARMELRFAPDGGYVFVTESNDGLDLKARGGSWHAVSQWNGRVTEGVYEILGPDRYSFSSAAEGKVIFERSSW